MKNGRMMTKMYTFNELAERLKQLAQAGVKLSGEIDAFAERKNSEPAPPAESLHEMAKRMCCGFGDCDGCPADMFSHCVVSGYAMLTAKEAEMQFTALRKWAAENPPKPVKTYREDFFEKFPDAYRLISGAPIPSLGAVHKVCAEKDTEYLETEDVKRWDKPLGYWEA